MTMTMTRPVTKPALDTSHGVKAHIIAPPEGGSAHGTVTEARVFGLPLVALCGKKFVPQRDAANLPVCGRCVEVFESHGAIGGREEIKQ